MSDRAQISVVLPAYNAERYLGEAVDSVLRQTVGDFECLIVDDGSTDRTGRICSELSRRDPRVRTIRTNHGGIVVALNAGIQESRGEFIARMDADDIALPQRFEKQVAFLRQHPDVVAVGSKVMLIDPYSSPLWEIEVRTSHEQIEAELLQASGWAMFHPAVIMRREAVLKVGGYRPEYVWSEDIDLFLRLAEIGKLANLPETLLHYRQHLSSVNRTRAELQVSTNERLLRETFARRGQKWPDGFEVKPPAFLDVYEQVHAWGRRAIINRNFRVARRHALAAVRRKPFKYASWSLIYHAALKR